MSLRKEFDRLAPETLVTGGLDVELHPTRPLVLLKLDGCPQMAALDDAGVQHLVTALMDCHERLWARVEMAERLRIPK